jgi:hypothetical protein
MPPRPLSRPQTRPMARPSFGGATGGGSSGVAAWVQQVVDPGFASAGSWTLTGAGIGTSAVTGGVLQVTSVTNVYFVLPATIQAPLDPGVYTVTYTVLNYIAGTIGTIASTSSALSGGTTGTGQTANGTYTETVTLPAGGYIGLGGQGAAIINNLQVDNMTIMRAA